jgi:hypothetical protein
MITRRLLGLLLPSARLVRLSCYFSVVFLALAGLSARAFYAHATDAALGFGRELSGLSEVTRDAEALLVNGQHFRHASVLVDESVPLVLDRLEAHCRKSQGPLGGALAELAATYPREMNEHAPPSAASHGVIREGDAERGMLICFTDQRSGGLAELTEAARRFVETSDLSSFGKVVYSYAERRSDGRSHVVTLWTESGLDLGSMFPATGDAAGEDSRVLPRPEHARRTLSAAAHGMPFGLRLYETSGSSASVQRFYDDWMRNNGWQVASRAEEQGASAYLRPDGYQAFLSVSAADERTYVTLIEAGRSDGPSVSALQVRE